ncbi:ParB/RepB/Spo0J family partition protein [Paraburkholderia sp. SARCC-3016]|uniref:ParB/RepB/Spo0J family partition protein n=1 Tax=Paraburkholderia sp. SARCC-3016 TaxID=3058611 RepID=UPI0028081E42|nr:ParB/RepB/Spo0J family partition protein [Paraburkholderia sp. SARCC-3016]MDQ7982449.1 ParB/RepB/Spo0J family partition protein [Paraburkholderia sp. SARCC-3016]
MMARKDFSQQINAGSARDQQLRKTKVSSRFDKIDSALGGRDSLLVGDADGVHATDDHTTFYVQTLEKEGKVTRTFARWPIDKIDDNPLNSRTIYSEEKIAARANSIAKEGQLVPALAARSTSDSSRIVLIDGHYRKRGAASLNKAELEVCILEGLQPIDFYRLARAANSEREAETTLDIAYGYQKLLDNGIAKSDDELARLIGENKSKVSKLLSLLQLPDAVRDIMAETPEPFGINISYEVALYHKAIGTDAKTIAFTERIRDEQLSFAKVKSIREALEQGKRVRKNMSRQYKIARADGTPLGTIKEWDNGRIVVDLALGNSETAQSYLALLREQLEKDGHGSTPAKVENS